MTMRKQILSGIKWGAAAKFGGQVITWGITLVVIRLLSPEDYGLLAMATIFVAFMLMVSEAGLTSALIQKQDIDEASLRQAFGIIIFINLILFVTLNLFAPIIAVFFSEERLTLILHVLSLQFIFVSITAIPEVLLYRKLKFKSLALIQLVITIISSVFTLMLAFAHYGVWALIFGTLSSIVLRAIAINVIAPFRQLPNFSLQGMRTLLIFGGNIALSRFLWFFYTQIDVIIVGKLLGKESLGFYSVAMQLSSLPVQRVSAIVSQVAFPIFSRFQHDREQLGSVAIKALRILSFIAFPVLWGISCVANEIVLLFLGYKWQSAILPLQLLSLMMPFRMLGNFLPSFTDAMGRPDVTMKNILLSSFVIPIALLVGAIEGGLSGVAIAWVIVSPVLIINNVRLSLRVVELQLRDFFRAIVPVVISAAGMYLMVWMIGSQLGDNIDHLTKLLIMIATGVSVYGGLTLFFNKQGYQEVINLVRQR